MGPSIPLMRPIPSFLSVVASGGFWMMQPSLAQELESRAERIVGVERISFRADVVRSNLGVLEQPHLGCPPTWTS